MTKAQLLRALKRTLNTDLPLTEVIRIRRGYINEASYYFRNSEELALEYLSRMRREAIKHAKKEMKKIVRDDKTEKAYLTTDSKMKQIDEYMPLLLSLPAHLQWRWLEDIEELTTQDKEDYKEVLAERVS